MSDDLREDMHEPPRGKVPLSGGGPSSDGAGPSAAGERLVRLQRLIARYGYASRRQAETLIREGRVKVDGVVIERLGAKVPPRAAVAVDGKTINRAIRKVYLLLNKPPGYVCTKKDPRGRKLVYELIDGKHRDLGVFTIGRLDYLSEGLLILTNDGEFAQKVGHPSGGVVKMYEVTTASPIPYNLVDSWREGVYINATKHTIRDWQRIDDRTALISLDEGKNREIRKLFKTIHCDITRLKRVAIGTIALGDLPSGRYRELLDREVEELATGRQGTPEGRT